MSRTLCPLILGLVCSALLACTREPASQPANTSAVAGPVAAAPELNRGESAPFVIEGDTVKVNNELCAVSHSPMAKNTLGQFVSRVKYDGANPRFAGKTLEFNQCCAMCIDKFPSLWAQNRDGILKFHGLE